MVRFVARGRIAWWCAIVLGVVLLVIGLVAKIIFLTVVGILFAAFGIVFLILSYVTRGQSD